MHARTIDETRELEGFVTDLSSILALQPAWKGQDRDFIVRSLGDELLRVLDLRFVFTRLPSPGALRDFITVDPGHGIREEDLTAALQPWLSPDSSYSAGLRIRETLSVVSLELGSKSLGTLIVAAARQDFPTRTETLLLRAAANQAAVTLLQNSNASVPQPHSLTQLHRFSTGLIEAGDLQAVLEQMLTAAIELQGADFGNVQLFDPVADGLVIVAQRNFQPPFLEHFALVRADDCACGLAAETRSRIIIEDTDADERFAPHRQVAREAGLRAVQSTPLFSHSGELLGMLSTHFRRPHRPSDHELRLTDIYVQQAARMIERKRTEEEKNELAAIVQDAQRELAHAGRVLSIGELTASLAHEINQPLAAIVANANASRRWLEREVPDYDRARVSLENIVRDGNRASAIIRRVREFASKVAPSRTRLKVNDVVREVVAIAAYEIQRGQVALQTDLAEDLPTVIADRLELQQVVLNLVINSIEALRLVNGRPRDLLITSTRRNKSTLEVSVRDNGSGIDAQHISRMFDAFFTTKSRGMGLGLAISRRIIEAHNGALWATPNAEWGLTMSFTLPVPGRR